MAEIVESDGYHGGFASNIPDAQLQKCSDSSNDLVFSLQQKGSLKSDPAVINLEIHRKKYTSQNYLHRQYLCGGYWKNSTGKRNFSNY